MELRGFADVDENEVGVGCRAEGRYLLKVVDFRGGKVVFEESRGGGEGATTSEGLLSPTYDRSGVDVGVCGTSSRKGSCYETYGLHGLSQAQCNALGGHVGHWKLGTGT